MAEVKFVFKVMRIQNIGGVFPPNVEILGSHGEWYLGKVSSEDALLTMREYLPIPVSDAIAAGFGLLTVNEINEGTLEEPSVRPLTIEEAANKDEALKLMRKLEARSVINALVGDPEDVVADLAKRVAILERIVYRVMKNQLPDLDAASLGLTTEQKAEYQAILDDYVTKVDDGTYLDRIDLQNLLSTFQRVQTRAASVKTVIDAANIVE